MKRLRLSFLLMAVLIGAVRAQQGGHDIRFNLKGLKDTTMYLARYYFDQTPIVDSCKHIKNGVVRFKGSDELTKGVYILATQERARFLEFMVDDTQHFSIVGDNADPLNTLHSPDSKENNEMLAYARFMTGMDRNYKKALQDTKGKNKADSAAMMTAKTNSFAAEIKKYDEAFMARNKGTFVWEFMNLRTEKFATDVPKASNGRPDSVYSYHYYKSHYFDGVNFMDNRILYTPFFASRLKKYFDEVIVQHPDTVIAEIDKLMSRCLPASDVYSSLLGYFTYKYETNKTMSFDKYGNLNTFEKVFIHLSDKYITNGKSYGYYSDETIGKVKEKVNILRHLQPNVKVPDLLVIDTINARKVLQMGFDTARTSESVTYLYNKNIKTLNPLFKTLYEVKAKYTVLVFWAADCGHCQKEIPRLHESLEQLKGKVDFKVFAVQTKEELYDSWKKFIIEKKLTGFIHVFDPVHINNLKEKFDITGTPVIYILDRDKMIKGKKVEAEQVADILINIDKLDKKP